MYCYVWEFRVPSERREAFEADYGPEGGWVALFRRDPDWVRTELLRDRDEPGHYLTVDVWRSRDAYLAFRRRFRAELDALDDRGEGWTAEERRLGEFELAGAAAVGPSGGAGI